MRRNVLVLHPTWPRPDRCAGDSQLFGLIQLLRRADHAVTVVGLDRLAVDERERYGTALIEMGCEVDDLFAQELAHTSWGEDMVKDKLRAIVERNRFDTALVSFWNVANTFSELLREAAPRMRIVIHSWDVWYLREVRGAALDGQLHRLQAFAASRHDELVTYARSDTVLAITDADAAVIATGMNAAKREGRVPPTLAALPPTITVPPVHAVATDPPPFSGRRNILFVGYFGHQPNVDAVQFLVQEIWPQIASRLPDAKLEIVGPGAPPEIEALANDRVQLLGFVPELEPLLDRARVSVAPLRFGAGLKCKVSQALAAGLPVVTTPTGAEGMPLVDGLHVTIGETATELADGIVALYSDEQRWQCQTEAGRAVVTARYSEVPVAARLFWALFGDLPEAETDITLPDDVRALESLLSGLDWQHERHCAPQAQVRFDEAIALDPTLFSAQLAAAALEIELGRLATANELWRAAYATAPQAVGVRATGAELLAAQGKQAQAAKAVAKLLVDDPRNPVAMRLEGELMLAAGNAEEANRLLKAARKTHANDYPTHRAYRQFALATGHVSLGLKMMEYELQHLGQIGNNAAEKQVRDLCEQIVGKLAGETDRLPADLMCPAAPSGQEASQATTAPAEKPAVTIVIPVFNKLELTLACLEAIRRNTPSDLYEVIIVDNASTDGTAEYLQEQQRQGSVRAIINRKNRGFATACNQGARAAVGEHVLFLNNDTEPRHGWLEPLLDILSDDPRAAAVGSKLPFADGTIQHAGVIVADDRKLPDPLVARHIYYREASDLPEANQPREYQALTAACLLVRREAFAAAGGFDEGYRNGYEDIDLCFTLRRQGWRLVYQPASEVVHHESQSGPARFASVSENIARLHDRWLDVIQPDLILQADGSLQLTDADGIRAYRHEPATAIGQVDAETRATSSQLQIRSARRGLTSIILLCCNAIDYSRRCIASLRENTTGPYEVICVDNGSSDGTVAMLRELASSDPRFRLIENAENLGFARGNNLGLAAARGEYLVLLNSDVAVTPGWLGRLCACADRYPSCGLVGPVTNCISGPQQLDEVAYDTETLSGLNDFARARAEAQAGKIRPNWRVVGFCMLIKRAVLARIGGLDERFGRGNFEDDDFCLRGLLAGFSSLIAQDCFVHHFGGRSFQANAVNFEQAMQENWEIFRRKWGVPEGVSYNESYDMTPHLQGSFRAEEHFHPLPAEDGDPVVRDGERLFETGRLEEAERLFRSRLQSVPDDLRARNDLACTLWRTGRSSTAIRELTAVLGIDPTNRDAVWNLGQLLNDDGRRQEAQQLYDAYLRGHPDDREIEEAASQLRKRAEATSRA